MKRVSWAVFLVFALFVAGCNSGSGSGSGSAPTPTGGGGGTADPTNPGTTDPSPPTIPGSPADSNQGSTTIYRKYVFVANYGSNTISSYLLDSTTGSLTPIETISAGNGGNPSTLTLSPKRDKLFVTKNGVSISQSNIQVFSIAKSTGALTPFQDVKAGGAADDATSVALSPNGLFAYVATDSASAPKVSVYSISSLTGMLSVTSTAGLARPSRCLVHTNGNFLLWSGAIVGDLFSIPISSTTGAVDASSAIATTVTSPEEIALSPDGRRVYVASFGSGDVKSFDINTTTGALSAIETKNIGATTRGFAISPDGKFAVTLAANTNTLSSLSIDQTSGLLNAVDTKTIGTYPRHVAFDPDGKFVFTANETSNNLSVFSLDTSTGILTTNGSTSAGTSPYFVVVAKVAQ